MRKVNKEPIYLRQRKRANGLISLYLDSCRDGKRVNEYLKLYLVPERTKEDREKNRQTLRLAQSIKAQRIVEIQSKNFGLDVTTHEDTLFFDVMRKIIERKDGTTKTSWQNCLAHFLKYEPN